MSGCGLHAPRRRPLRRRFSCVPGRSSADSVAVTANATPADAVARVVATPEDTTAAEITPAAEEDMQ